MDLTPQATQQADFAKVCFLRGMCTPKEYLKAVKTIYQDDVKKQTDFLMDQGFKRMEAVKHIYKLDKGEEIL